MKRMLAYFIAFCMCIGLVSAPVLAEKSDEVFDESLYFNDFNNQAELNSLTLTRPARSEFDAVITDDGATAMKAYISEGTGQTGYAYAALPVIKNEDTVKSDVAFEFRIRNKMNGNCFISTKMNTHSILLSGTNIKLSMYKPEAEQGFIGKYSYNTWNTYTVVYHGDKGYRSIYKNGELLADGLDGADTQYGQPNNPWYKNDRLDLQLWIYLQNTGEFAEFDYLSVYKIPESLDMSVVDAKTVDLKEIYLDFNAGVNLEGEMISIPGAEIESVELADKGKNIYRVKVTEPFEIKSDYEITVSGASDIFGNTLEKTVGFTTRDKVFETGAIVLNSILGEIPSYAEGPCFAEGSFVNELDSERTAGVVAATYGKGGKMISSFIKEYTVAGEDMGYVYEDLNLPAGENEVLTMIWEGAEKPVPIGDLVSYGKTKKTVDYKAVNTAFSGTADLGLEIITVKPKDEEKTVEKLKITLTLDGAEREYLTGILVKAPDGSVEYAGGKKTVSGAAVYEIPLEIENVGEYSVICGVERGGTVSGKIDYYSPVFISGMISENINSEDADAESAAEFVSILGEYMGMDAEGYGVIEDKERALDIFLELKLLEESGVFDSEEKIRNAFSTAVAMEKIYEGKNTAEVLSEAFELPENVKTAIDTVISSEGKQFMLEALKGADLKIPGEVMNEAKTAVILGGVYKAENYLQVNELINTFGEELGINLQAYSSLKSPSAVSKAVMNNSYYTTEAFAAAANKLIAERKKAEATTSSKPSGGGGGGGGGGGAGKININTATQKTPEPEEKEEDKKEEEKKISFPDVKENDWFYSDVMWAAEKGIFIGTDKGEFLPAMNLTLEHIYIVLGRMGFEYPGAAEKRDITRAEFAELLYKNLCKDDNYKDAKSWIEGNGIFKGDQNGNMMYDKSLTRAECCTVLRRIEK